MKKRLLLFLSLFTFYSFISYGQTLKIMPLGDSITRGATKSTKGGYRGPLRDSLTNVNYGIDFVGDKNGGIVSGDDNQYAGYSGYTTTQIADSIHYWLDTLSILSQPLPNIILLHIGTNDIEDGGDSVVVKYNVRDIVDTIKTYESNNSLVINIFIAKIINRNDKLSNSTKSQITTGYNNQLKLLVDSLQNTGDKVFLVNMETGAGINYNIDTTLPYNSGDMWNNLHPNQSGYNKMAHVWYQGIQNFFTPSLLMPIADAEGVSINPNLTWTASPISNSSTRYQYQISTDLSFSNIVIDSSNLENSFSNLTEDLDYGTIYYWRTKATNFGGTSNWSSIRSFTTEPMPVFVKVFLQGPYDSTASMMDTTLKANNLIPKSQQPYNVSPWNYNGTEHVTSIPDSVVDWVLVELRTNTDSASTVARRAVFLKEKGGLVDTNKTARVNFSGISPGNYYIVIRHRNHLAIMSKNPVSLPNTSGTTYDFTKAQNQAYSKGANGMVSLGGNPEKFGMYSGDANADGSPDSFDDNLIWKPANGQPFDYSTTGRADYNLDGGIDAFDSNLYWRPNNGTSTQVPN